MKISILGAGSFGTSIAVHLSKNVDEIYIWGNSVNVINEINENRTNKGYLKDLVNIPSNIYASTNLNEVISNSKYVILAVPSHSIAKVANQIKHLLQKEQIIINLAKGLDASTLERLSEVIKKETHHKKIVALSGPSHAEEIVRNIPTTIVAACEDISLAEEVQKDLSTKTLRIYSNPDILGVEISGASKNIIALAAGILDGLGYGDNAKAALMVRGMNEIINIGTFLGGDIRTFNGLSGMGDLIVTCTSVHSRNRQAGVLLASGKSLEETLSSVGMVVEGIKACEAFHSLSIKNNIEMPITTALYNIVFNGCCPRTEIYKLLSRDKKQEF